MDDGVMIVSFESFMKDRLSIWMGSYPAEYDPVDRHRALEARSDEVKNERAITNLEDRAKLIKGTKLEGFPDFGHTMLKHWQFDERCMSSKLVSFLLTEGLTDVNLNHG